MRIWTQSCAGIDVDESFQRPYEALKRVAKQVCRPDTQVDIHGIGGSTIPGIDAVRTVQHYCASRAIRNAMRAEQEGYDAFLLHSTIDVGFYEIREVVDIPVVYPTEAVLHLACLLAPKFSFIAHNEALLYKVTELAVSYGLERRMVPGAYLSLSYRDAGEMYKNPQPYIDSVTQVAKQVVARGANILILVANWLGRWLLEQGVRQIDGAVIMDVWAGALKMTELMVDLDRMGIKRSKTGAFAPPSEESLTAIKKLYASDPS